MLCRTHSVRHTGPCTPKTPDPGQPIWALAPPRHSTRGMWRCWKTRSGQGSRERRVGKGRASSAAPRQTSCSAPGCEPRRRWRDYSPGISAIGRLAPACCLKAPRKCLGEGLSPPDYQGNTSHRQTFRLHHSSPVQPLLAFKFLSVPRS